MDWIGQVALATLLVGLFAWLRADLTALRKEFRNEIIRQGEELRRELVRQGTELRGEMTGQGNDLRAEFSLLGKEVGKLRERMAHMEGLLEGLREAVTSKRAA